MMKKIAFGVLVVLCTAFCGCGKNAEVDKTEGVDYSTPGNWVYINYGEEKPADCFLINDFSLDSEAFDTQNEILKNSVVGDVNKQIGMYTDNCRMFVPYYRQNLLTSDTDDEYNDIKSAFEYYLENYNEGRPIVLASNSSGGDDLIRLLKDELDTFSDRFVAAYEIGWFVKESDIEDYPLIVPAQQSNDAGVLVSYVTEKKYEEYEQTDKVISINPLNWTADGTPADESYNMGACFFDDDGNMTDEVYQFCGGTVDEKTGALTLSGVDYDNGNLPENTSDCEYTFFYRNIQYNVAERVEAFYGDDD